jgi:hypothetical protein
MTILEALSILEAATLECEKRNVNTPEVAQALGVLESFVQPKWLIPQFRNHLDGERRPGVEREGKQQGLRATYPKIRDSVRDLIGKHMDARSRATSPPLTIRKLKPISSAGVWYTPN